ncbi:MAG: choice-of-anchor B family protein [Bacteroidetes bacterium]|nr:choice-of-anchor B family protein [Bacteroidota bacterium]
MKNLLLITSAFCHLTFYIHSQNVNITLAGQLSYGTQELSNIWGWKSPVDGKEYALVGAANGLSIVDVSNPSAPTEIIQVPVPPASANCSWREVKTWGNYAYVTTECGTMGLQIIDLTNLPATNLLTATWTPTINTVQLKTIHALHIDNGKLYLYGSNVGGQGAIIADVSTTPMAPVYLGSYDAGGYIHDGYVRNDTMYASHVYAGTVEIVNLTNPASGIPLASFSTPDNFTHNTWLSTDGKTCFTTDEVNNSFLAAFDISNFSNITLLDKIQSNPGSGSIVHNTYIVNKFGIDYAVTSWYKDGLTIVDASNPSNLIQVGNYDTSPSMSGGGYGGCWGVYPFLPSGIIVASDIELGLFVLNSVHLTTGVNENTVENLPVNVYPNPNNGKFTVYGLQFPVQIHIYNSLGEIVREQTVNSKQETVNLSEARSGIYFYQLFSNDKIIATGKLCVE